jgi:hypothetical protein
VTLTFPRPQLSAAAARTTKKALKNIGRRRTVPQEE